MYNKLLSALTKRIPKGRISFLQKDLMNHAKDKSYHKEVLPDVVVWPKTTQEVSIIMQFANKNNIPVTPWGGGSSLQGNPIPVKGGIILDMTKMDKVINIVPNGLQVCVQPGIIGDLLNKYLKKYSLFFPAFPGSSHIATIGGMIANNAGGMYAVKYGVTGDYVMELEVVLANGEIISVGGKTVKSVSGYNLLPLFIGSEGTLGVVTQATLKLLPIPEAKMACVVTFLQVEDATKTVHAILQSGVTPAALELMDESYVSMVNTVQKEVQLEVHDSLLIELHGTKDYVRKDFLKIKAIFEKYTALSFTTFESSDACEKLWACRKGIRIAFKQRQPDTGIASAEVAVPLDKISDFITKTKQLQRVYNLQMLNHGHVGDGNFHTWVLYNLTDTGSLQKTKLFNHQLTMYTLGIGGTATGEHGLGLSKKSYLPLEHPTSIRWMSSIKKLFDPQNILNPGKIFPD